MAATFRPVELSAGSEAPWRPEESSILAQPAGFPEEAAFQEQVGRRAVARREPRPRGSVSNRSRLVCQALGAHRARGPVPTWTQAPAWRGRDGSGRWILPERSGEGWGGEWGRGSPRLGLSGPFDSALSANTWRGSSLRVASRPLAHCERRLERPLLSAPLASKPSPPCCLRLGSLCPLRVSPCAPARPSPAAPCTRASRLCSSGFSPLEEAAAVLHEEQNNRCPGEGP